MTYDRDTVCWMLGELVLANYALREQLELYRRLESLLPARLYENLAANAGVAPADRRIEADTVDRVLAQIYEGHDG
jgi:hypothetical protein